MGEVPESLYNEKAIRNSNFGQRTRMQGFIMQVEDPWFSKRPVCSLGAYPILQSLDLDIAPVFHASTPGS